MTTPGPYADLISHAAKIIVEAKAQPHSAPAHWAGALWEAGMLVGPGVAPSIDDAESMSAALRRAEQERDKAREDLSKTSERALELKGRLVAMAGDHARELARIDEAAGRDIAAPDEPLLYRIADLRRGRNEATQRALELAAELASARQELDAVRTARDRLDRGLGAARDEVRRLRDQLRLADARIRELDPPLIDTGEGLLTLNEIELMQAAELKVRDAENNLAMCVQSLNEHRKQHGRVTNQEVIALAHAQAALGQAYASLAMAKSTLVFTAAAAAETKEPESS